MPIALPRPNYGGYLKAAEVERRTGIPVATLRNWCRMGLVPGAIVTPTGQYLVPESSVDGLLRPATQAERGQESGEGESA